MSLVPCGIKLQESYSHGMLTKVQESITRSGTVRPLGLFLKSYMHEMLSACFLGFLFLAIVSGQHKSHLSPKALHPLRLQSFLTLFPDSRRLMQKNLRNPESPENGTFILTKERTQQSSHWLFSLDKSERTDHDEGRTQY